MNPYREKLLKDIGINKKESELKFVEWFDISRYSNLSDEFLLEFKNRIFWTHYFKNKPVSYEVMKSTIFLSSHSEIKNFRIEHLSNSQQESIQKILDLKNIFKK
jgi:hypothetical protein